MKIPWNRKVLRDFFLTFEGCFPLFFSYGGFPLPSGNAPDKVLHPFSTFPLHLIGDMTVDIQCKGGGGMAQVALHGLNVVPAFYRCHGIRVAQVMKSGISTTNRGGYSLKPSADGLWHEMSAHFVGEHKAAILPGGANR